jgi:hypothetical protein
MRAKILIGMAVVLTLAPAFCCCQLRMLTTQFRTAVWANTEHCCNPRSLPNHSSCCRKAQKSQPRADETGKKPQQPEKPRPGPSGCRCYGALPIAILPDPPPELYENHRVGKLPPLPITGQDAVVVVHCGQQSFLTSRLAACGDIRYTVLSLRHVLRC